MKHTIISLLILISLFIRINVSQAQIKLNPNPTGKSYANLAASYKKLPEDSLISEFRNTIYYTFYSVAYMKNHTATFTTLKVDVDFQGKVTDIRFSDSADSVFVRAWQNKTPHDDKATLEQYAKLKGYRNISLLIPVSYQLQYPNQQKVFTYDELSARTKFNHKNFSGLAVVFNPIDIVVLAKGNM